MPGSTDTLIAQADSNIAQLLRRFETIVALAAPGEKGSLTTTSIETYQIEIEKAALIRGAENILTLTRALKEAWLFGKLNTVGSSKAEEETDRHAKMVILKLEKITDPRVDPVTALEALG